MKKRRAMIVVSDKTDKELQLLRAKFPTISRSGIIGIAVEKMADAVRKKDAREDDS